MKITRRQLRRIIREAYAGNPLFQGAFSDEQTFTGVPYLEDSYKGNGHVPGNYFTEGWKMLLPVLEEIGDPSFVHAIGVLRGRYSVGGKPLYYIPFVYGDRVLQKLQQMLDEGTAPSSLTQAMIMQAARDLNNEDAEYVDY